MSGFDHLKEACTVGEARGFTLRLVGGGVQIKKHQGFRTATHLVPLQDVEHAKFNILLERMDAIDRELAKGPSWKKS